MSPARDADSFEALDARCAFVRPEDRGLFEQMFFALTRQGKSVVLASSSEPLLDHYGKLLVNALRAQPQLQVEVYFPGSVDALLERINQSLGGITLEQARERGGSEQAVRVLVVTDARHVPVNEAQLLLRLVNDFPGANLRVVLMVERPEDAQVARLMQGFDRRHARWDIQTPDRVELEDLYARASAQGHEREVARLVLRLGGKASLAASLPSAARADQTAAPTQGSGTSGSAESPFPAALPPSDREEARGASDADALSPPRKNPSVMLIALALLIASAIIVSVLYWGEGDSSTAEPDAAPATVAAPAPAPLAAPELPPNTLVGTVVVEQAATSETPEPAQPAVVAEETPEPPKAEPPKPEPPKPEPPKPEPPKPEPPKPEPPKPAPAPIVITVPAPAVVAPLPAPAPVTQTAAPPPPPPSAPPPVAAKPPAPPPPVARPDPPAKPAAKPPAKPAAPIPAPNNGRNATNGDNVRRVLAAPEGSYFVQMAARRTAEEAETWRRARPDSAQTLVLRVQGPVPEYPWIIVAGPFQTREAAIAAQKREGMPTDAWVRSARALQNVLRNAQGEEIR